MPKERYLNQRFDKINHCDLIQFLWHQGKHIFHALKEKQKKSENQLFENLQATQVYVICGNRMKALLICSKGISRKYFRTKDFNFYNDYYYTKVKHPSEKQILCVMEKYQKNALKL